MTTHPKTLLEIAGASRQPSPLSESALILIDTQIEARSSGLRPDSRMVAIIPALEPQPCPRWPTASR